MTTAELITNIKLMMGEEYSDELLSAYIQQAQTECVNWEYQLVGIPEDLDMSRYDFIVINAVMVGLSLRGAEGETQHSENGILRGYKWSSMADYIHHVIVPYARTI